MYRYRDTNCSTKGSLRAMKHLLKLGTITAIRGYIYFGRYNTLHVGVMVHGENGTCRFGGFSWGYGGEGPRGLNELFARLNVPQAEQARIQSIPWTGWNAVREVWRIDMTALEQRQAA